MYTLSLADKTRSAAEISASYTARQLRIALAYKLGVSTVQEGQRTTSVHRARKAALVAAYIDKVQEKTVEPSNVKKVRKVVALEFEGEGCDDQEEILNVTIKDGRVVLEREETHPGYDDGYRFSTTLADIEALVEALREIA